MTIDEAIKVNMVLIKAPVIKDDEVCVDALKLGIEALKREKARREGHFTMVGKLLPSETPPANSTRSLHHIKEVLESPLGREPRG